MPRWSVRTVAAALVGFSTPLLAQAHLGAIRGRVINSAGTPLPGVEAVLGGTNIRATTDSTGAFLLHDIVPGRYALVVRRVGFEPARFGANVFADDTIQAPIVLQVSAQTLDTVRSRAVIPARQRLDEMATIKRTGMGTLFDSADIARHQTDKVSDLLRTKINGAEYWPRSCGGTAVAASNGIGTPIDISVSKRQKLINVGGCIVPRACYFQIYVDGSKLYSYDQISLPPDIDGISVLTSIEVIEVFNSGANTPAEYNSTGAACGTIAIWLKR